MRSSNHNARQTSSVEGKSDRPQRGKFKGLLAKASKGVVRPSNIDTNNHLDQRHHAVDDMKVNSRQHRRTDDFLPNPKIIESPEGTPPKNKIWEGAYRNFLSLGKSHSPSESDLSKSPDTKKASFAIIPGTKRLVTQAPSHGIASRNGTTGTRTGRAQSMSLLDNRNQSQSQSDVLDVDSRGAPSFMKGVFNRSTSDGSVSVPRRTRNYSSGSSPDDLDSAMRKGMNKHSPDYAHVSRKQMIPSAPPRLPHVRAASQEDIPTGLEALLSGASTSPHFTIETAGVPRAASHGMFHPISESMDKLSSHYPFYLPKRDSNGSFNYHQAGLCLEDDSPGNSSSSSDARRHRSKSCDWNSRGNLQAELQGSLLSQQVAAHAGTDYQQHHHQQPHPGYSYEHQTYPQHVQFRPIHPGQIHPTESYGHRYGSAIEGISPPVSTGGLGSLLRDQNFNAGTSPSSLVYQQGHESPANVPVNPQMKKVFTTFHNQARFASDATSPFLGGEESPSPLHHDSYVSYHMMMGGGGISVPYHGKSHRRRLVLVMDVPF